MGSVNLIVVSAPAGQILYGTGPSVGSDAAFFRDIADATNRYGLNIGSVSGATNNYALKTDLGLVQLGDQTSIGGPISGYFDTTPQLFVTKTSTDEVLGLDGVIAVMGHYNPAANGGYAYGFFGEQDVVSGNTRDLTELLGLGFNARHSGSGAIALHRGAEFIAYLNGGDSDEVYGVASYVAREGGAGNSDRAAAYWGQVRINAAGTFTEAAGTYIQTPTVVGGGSIGTFVSFYSEALGGTATNPYSFWADDQGVLRIKSDNAFDATYQAIIAGYNPLFTKYVAGASNYERWTIYWDGDVANFGTVKGGTGTLRPVRLIGSQVQFVNAAVPSVSDGAALGSTSLQWSDLFLASGGVINFANGDIALTHSSDLLTMAGGNLLVSGLVAVGAGASIGSGATLFGFKVAPTSGATAGQTAFIQDATATTGHTKLVLQQGALGGGANKRLVEFRSAAGTAFGGFGSTNDSSNITMRLGTGEGNVDFTFWNDGTLAIADNTALVSFGAFGSISFASDGVLKLLNTGGSGFTRLQFGGTTSSFPSLKRATTTLHARLADDSADAGFLCGAFTASGNVSFFGATPTAQGAAVADATGGATIDAEARTAINALISRIEATGLIATV